MAEYQPYLTEDEFSKAEESTQGSYVRRDDGRYFLNVVERDGVALEDVKGLRSTVEATRSERDKAIQRLKAFGDVDPKAIKDALEKAAKFDDLDPAAEAGKLKKQFDSWKEEFQTAQTEEWQGKVSGVEEVLMARTKQLGQVLVEAQATQVMMHPDVKGRPGVLIPVIKTMTDLVEENGNLRVRILSPKTGHERIGKDGSPMEFAELFKELRANPEFAGCFDGNNQGGGGSQEGSDTGTPGNYKRSEMTEKQKADFIHKNGIEGYFKLPQ